MALLVQKGRLVTHNGKLATATAVTLNDCDCCGHECGVDTMTLPEWATVTIPIFGNSGVFPDTRPLPAPNILIKRSISGPATVTLRPTNSFGYYEGWTVIGSGETGIYDERGHLLGSPADCIARGFFLLYVTMTFACGVPTFDDRGLLVGTSDVPGKQYARINWSVADFVCDDPEPSTLLVFLYGYGRGVAAYYGGYCPVGTSPTSMSYATCVMPMGATGGTYTAVRPPVGADDPSCTPIGYGGTLQVGMHGTYDPVTSPRYVPPDIRYITNGYGRTYATIPSYCGDVDPLPDDPSSYTSDQPSSLDDSSQSSGSRSSPSSHSSSSSSSTSSSVNSSSSSSTSSHSSHSDRSGGGGGGGSDSSASSHSSASSASSVSDEIVGGSISSASDDMSSDGTLVDCRHATFSAGLPSGLITSGTVTWDGTRGLPAGSLRTDGGGSYVYFSTSTWSVTGDFRLTADVLLVNTSREIANVAFWVNSPGSGANGFMFRVENGADCAFLQVSGGGHGGYISSTLPAVSSGIWYRVVIRAVGTVVQATVRERLTGALHGTVTQDLSAYMDATHTTSGTIGQKQDGAGGGDGQRWDNVELCELVGASIPSSSSTSSASSDSSELRNTSVSSSSSSFGGLPGDLPHGALITAINCGGDDEYPYVADVDYSGGFTFSTGSTIDRSGVADAAPIGVYQTERFGDYTYAIPVGAAGTAVVVRLHFAEIYWSNSNARIFDVAINGMTVLHDLDVFREAGGQNVAIAASLAAVADSSGNITITTTSVRDQAKISGIQVWHAGTGHDSASSQSSDGEASSVVEERFAIDTPAKQAASVAKAIRRYGPAGGGVRAIVPVDREAVLAAFEPLMLAHPWIVSVGMTGSAIFAEQTVRDLDVVLLVDDWGAWESQRGTLDLPTQVDGRKLDIFAKQVPASGDHAVLDLFSLRLYVPSHYSVTGADAGITIDRSVEPVVALPGLTTTPTKAKTACVPCARARRSKGQK